MEFKYVIYEKREQVARVILNRPEVGNALDPNLGRDLLLAVREIQADDAIRVVVLTGAGKAFCAGGDVRFLLEDVSRRTVLEIRDFLKEMAMPILALRELRQPVIAAINGPAVGAGFDLLLHCDLRVTSENAMMGPTWIRNGIVPALGGMYLLARFVGQTRAAEMILRGQTVSGREAEAIGLVNKAVPRETLEEEVGEIAQDLAKRAPVALAIAKRGLQRGIDAYLHHEMEHAVYLQSSCMKTDDFKEGLTAFLEKREPKFSGH